MGAWEKVFSDRTFEIGRDEDVNNNRASWSKGRLDDMVACWLLGFMCKILITIPDTEWHQFDRYEVPLAVGSHNGRRIIRVLQAKIQPEHKDCVIQYSIEGEFDHLQKFEFSKEPSGDAPSILIEEEHVGKWFTVTIDFNGTIRFCFTDKGKYT
jgi:hypothetical protein